MGNIHVVTAVVSENSRRAVLEADLLGAVRRHGPGRAFEESVYDAAAKDTLGVPVIDTGGKKRVPSIAVLRRLGFDDDAIVAAIVGQDTAPATEVVEASLSPTVTANVAKTVAVKTARPKRRRARASSNKAAA